MGKGRGLALLGLDIRAAQEPNLIFGVERRAMTGKVLMVQGTASDAGKSVLVAALCRIFLQDGFRVAPFKAQNMSNNSYVTPDGGEIGRAQAVQAEAAGIEPTVEMNPVLLKPEADNRSQVVVLGKLLRSVEASAYFQMNHPLWQVVSQSLDKLRSQYEVVVIEGAGSPAEINLKQTEIVNMRVARYADAPVLLVGDIERGGVFASLVGTLELLEPEERACVKAFVINKFRGDIAILEPGLRWLEDRTGIPVAGVIPYFRDIQIAEEDSVARKPHGKAEGSALLDIAVVCLPHISNFDDFDPLEPEAGVALRYIHTVDDLGAPDMVILPGTKNTVADLEWLREKGIASRIQSLGRDGAVVMGICGGYQMLGARILDPELVESPQGETEGLSLLAVTTVFAATKETHRVKGEVLEAPGILHGARGLPIEGYEIHMGRTFLDPKQHTGALEGPTSQKSPSNTRGNTTQESQDSTTFTRDQSPFYIQERSGNRREQPDGTIDRGGRILGTYIHGLFHNAGLRRTVLRSLAQGKAVTLPAADDLRGQASLQSRDEEYDKLAALVRSSLNMDLIYHVAGLKLPEL